MKLPPSLPKPNKRKRAHKRPLVLIRRVVGESMLPYLKPEHVVIAFGNYKALQPGDVVVFRHQGLDKIKRVYEIAGEYVYLLGDNPEASTDSRAFGYVHISTIVAKVWWPETSPKTKSPS